MQHSLHDTRPLTLKVTVEEWSPTGQKVLVRLADRCTPWNVNVFQQPVISVVNLHGAALVEEKVG